MTGQFLFGSRGEMAHSKIKNKFFLRIIIKRAQLYEEGELTIGKKELPFVNDETFSPIQDFPDGNEEKKKSV